MRAALALSGILLAGQMAWGQSAAPAAQSAKGTLRSLVGEAIQDYARVDKNILAAAAAMPAANYTFKPTPEIRSFGELFTHVIEAQTMVCSTLAGAPQRAGTVNAANKEEVEAALKTSSDLCDRANATVTEANALDIVGHGYFGGPKVELIEKNAAHDNEMYGTMAVYLRLKGVVPPSSRPRGGK